MGLNARPVIPADWFEAVRRPSRGFETALVEIINPGMMVEVPYNPETGLGGDRVPSVVWPIVPNLGEQPYGDGPYGGLYSEGANAWVEIIGTSSQQNAAPQPTDITAAHVHIDLARFGSTENIRPGFQIRVRDGGRDKTLERRLITIDKVTTGNLAVQRTLECRIDEKAYI